MCGFGSTIITILERNALGNTWRMQGMNRKNRGRRVCKRVIKTLLLTGIPVCLLLMLEYHYNHEIGLMGADAKVYLSIADNLIQTGHFIQTSRSMSEGMVVPPGVPAVLTLLRLISTSKTILLINHILLFSTSLILLYIYLRSSVTRVPGGRWAIGIFRQNCRDSY